MSLDDIEAFNAACETLGSAAPHNPIKTDEKPVFDEDGTGESGA